MGPQRRQGRWGGGEAVLVQVEGGDRLDRGNRNSLGELTGTASSRIFAPGCQRRSGPFPLLDRGGHAPAGGEPAAARSCSCCAFRVFIA